MLTVVKKLVKSQPLIYQLAKRLLRTVQPAYRIRDLTKQWYAAISARQMAKAFALYADMREIQHTLAARLPDELRQVRFLREDWTAYIGHTSLLDNHVKARLMGWQPDQPAVIVTEPRRIANPFFLNLWRRYFSVVTDRRSARRFWHASHVNQDFFNIMELPQGRFYQYDAWAMIQRAWAEQNRLPLLTLDDETRHNGWQALHKLGVPHGGWFVALHVRESGFFRKNYPRDFIRDANIDTYEEAMRAITRRGGWIVRCGDSTMKPLRPMPQVIDYAHSDLKADWMDIFLCSQCRFFLGTHSGLGHVPANFGVPTLYTNWVSWGQPPPNMTDFFIPKLYWNNQVRRLAMLDEVLASDLKLVLTSDHVDMGKFTLIDNTPEEIRQAVEELMNMLNTGKGMEQASLHDRYQDHGIMLNSRIMLGFIDGHRGLFF